MWPTNSGFDGVDVLVVCLGCVSWLCVLVVCLGCEQPGCDVLGLDGVKVRIWL
jgi:hypothetical protein